MKTSNKILFLPNYLGGGFGHTGRCLALADYFRLKGNDCRFVLSGEHAGIVRNEGYETYVASNPIRLSSNKEGPAYLYVPDMSYQIVRDGFDSPEKVKAALLALLKIVNQFKPDILLGDGYVLTSIVGKLMSIPVVQIVKSAVHPSMSNMIFWEKEPQSMIAPDPRPVFNPVFKKYNLAEIQRAEDLLFGDLLILPSIPELDPMSHLPENTYYSGSIIRNSKSCKEKNILDEIPRDRPIVYITIGGAAGNYAQNLFFKIFAKAFEKTSFRVIISTGGKPISLENKDIPDNVQFVPWVDNNKMFAISSCVIFHGGYTRMEIIKAGLPSIIIPFHSEQEYYGRIFETAGVAKMVAGSQEPYQHIKMFWDGGKKWWQSKKEFSVYIRKNVTLCPKLLLNAVNDVIVDKSIQDNVKCLQSKLAHYKGAETVLDLIQAKF